VLFRKVVPATSVQLRLLPFFQAALIQTGDKTRGQAVLSPV
jgi:hypothetical protein